MNRDVPIVHAKVPRIDHNLRENSLNRIKLRIKIVHATRKHARIAGHPPLELEVPTPDLEVPPSHGLAEFSKWETP